MTEPEIQAAKRAYRQGWFGCCPYCRDGKNPECPVCYGKMKDEGWSFHQNDANGKCFFDLAADQFEKRLREELKRI